MTFDGEKIVPRPPTQEEMDDIFVYWPTKGGGMIGYFPSRVYGNNQQDGGNEAE